MDCAFFITTCNAAGNASVTPMTRMIIRLAKGCRVRRPSAADAVFTWSKNQFVNGLVLRGGESASDDFIAANCHAPFRLQVARHTRQPDLLLDQLESSLKRRKIRMTSSDRSGSRLPVGSSAISNFGRLTMARAIPTRCCSPEDNVSGDCFSWLRRLT